MASSLSEFASRSDPTGSGPAEPTPTAGPSALANLRVVEIGQGVSGPYCGKLLADLGADVVKVESPMTGDPLRRAGSFPDDVPDRSAGGLFRYLNANKRSIECAPGSVAGKQALLALVAGADLVIENLGPGVLEGYGVGWDWLEQANPKIALVRISDYGQTGPYSTRPGTDLTVQAAANWVSNHHNPSQEPVQAGGRLADFTAGVYAATAALTAVSIAAAGGKAISVDVSKQECLTSCIGAVWLHVEKLQAMGWGIPAERYFPLPGVVRCKDGLVSVNALTGQHFIDCCHLLGVPEYSSKQLEIAYGGTEFDAFFRDIAPWLKERTVEEVVELFQAVRIPAVPISDGKTLLDLPQFKARSFFLRDPQGNVTQPGFPYRLELTPATLRKGAPRLGEDNLATGSAPWRPRESAPIAARRNKRNFPFEGLRVLDLGAFWAGPYVSCYLGAYGADVIKVESIQRPDAFRYHTAYPQEGPDWYERSSIWQHANLNKRDLTLNLEDTEGKHIFERLVVKADVFIENFSPRVIDNFGFSVERLKEINPNLIIVRLPGFGLEGPWREFSSFAMPLEQASGMAWVTGHPDGPPLNPGGYADAIVGMHALVALQAALLYRERTGQAQMIEVPQIEVGACMTGEQAIAYSMTGKIMGRMGNRSDTMAPQGVYPCLSGESVAASIRDDSDWQRFREMPPVHTWAMDERFSSLAERRARHDELDGLISRWTSRVTADSVIATLRDAGIPAAIVLTQPNIVSDPNLVARKFFEELDHPRTGLWRYSRWPWLQSVGPTGTHRSRAPLLGEHNYEILHGELGLSDDEIAQLAAKDVVGTVPKGLG
ncbi:MAG: CoA transferase [Candidatus Binatia bacterium]